MTNIQTFQFNTKDITCHVVNGDPWFKGNDIASILGYARPNNAVREHIPEKFKQSYQSLISSVGPPKTGGLDHNDKTTLYINEAGLYKLIFRSKNKQAEAFSDWVCCEVLPSIRKHGAYITKEKAIELYGLIDDDQEEALRRIRNPRGETKLHYDVVSYIKRNYPHVVISAGLGECQITHFARMDSKLKGYTKGEPDLELKCKSGDHTDVVAIELKNPNGTNQLSIQQEEYIELLQDINVSTLVSNNYMDIIDWVDNHYKQIRRLAKRTSSFDFSTNDRPAYWLNKLYSKERLLNECKIRQMDIAELWRLTNRDIASVLITFDQAART